MESVKAAILTGRKFYVSWSGGKDSTAMLHMVRGIMTDIQVMHIRNGYQLPDTSAFIEKIASEWSLKLTEIDSPVDYWTLCGQFGLPHTRTPGGQKKIVKTIKKDVAADWADKEGFTGLFWGLRAEESRGRRMMTLTHKNGIIDKKGRLRVSPIALMSSRDIWAYHIEHGIPWATCYDRETHGETRHTIRNTGWLSTDGESHGRIEWLRRHYPTQYQKLRELL